MSSASQNTFLGIKKHFTVLYAEWCIYDQLFGSSENVELLNDSAANVFVILQNSILDNCVLAFSRLTDKAKSGSNKNLSIPRLVEELKSENFESSAELESILEELVAVVAVLRRHRHKRIAHLDLDTATAKKELEPYKFGDISQAFELVEKLLNTYESKKFGSTTAYKHTIHPLGSDGDSLIRLLKLAKEAKNLELEKRVARMMSK